MSLFKIHIKTLLTLLLAVALLGSCTKDNIERKITNDGAMVTLNIHTPGSSLPTPTRASDDDECAVLSIKIVVLEKDGTIYRYKYMTDGQQIMQNTSNSEITSFTALLKSSAEPLKLLLVANPIDVFDNLSVSEGMSESDLKSVLVDNFRSDIGGRLPIYGEVELAELKTDKVNEVSATMLRGVARVDVRNQVNSQVTKPFELKSVHIFRANDKIRISPEDNAYKSSTSLTVASPSVPADAGFMSGSYSKLIDTDPLSITKLYLPESEAVPDQQNRTLGSTCVVVGGIFDDDGVVTYYRVNFDSKLEGHPFGQVLRNHKYIFNIKQVTDSGWSTPEDAANNESTLITAVLQVWDEATSEMYYSDDENYLGISSRKITLEYFEGAEQTVYLQTTLGFEIQALDDTGNPTGPIITSANESLDNGFYNLKIVKDNSDGTDVYRLVMTATDENLSEEPYTGKFLVKTPFWQFDVTVEQETYIEMYRNRFIHVLTVTDLYGDLGYSDGTLTDGVSGSAMRKVLENPANFSPTGTKVIKGIVIHDFSNDKISSSAPEYMYVLKKLLEHIDVVHLAYKCSPSQEASKIIYEWLTENKNRVLIMGTDSPDTNEHLQQYFQEADGDWFDGAGKIQKTGNIIKEDGQEPFFDGKFGEVGYSDDMGFVDGIMGYNDGFNDLTTIALLRITAGTDISQMITLGVNTDCGVIYMGESEVYSSRGNAMSSNAEADGSVHSDFDILMANKWAWIIDRVVRGI